MSPTSILLEARPVSSDAAFDYVVKTLRAELEEDASVVHAFRREAALGHRTNHPHVVSVLCASVAAAPYYFVMPRLHGMNVAERLKLGTAIPPAEALWITRQAADGLFGLHQNGWIHGDVQPANIHLSGNGHTTICDLGLASPICHADVCCDQRLTGGLGYIAPEMLTSRWRASAASDVYSLGAVLFEMLTGRPLCPSHDPGRIAEFHLHEMPPSIRTWLPRAPRRLSQCVTAMLAKDPLRRPSTDGNLQSLLTRLEIDMFDVR